jgi:hypothetical protein
LLTRAASARNDSGTGIAPNYGVADPNVVVHHVRIPEPARPIEEWSDEDINAQYQRPMGLAYNALHHGRADGVTRFVFVLPPTTSAASEGVRLLALGAARQWADEGVTVNCIVGEDNLAAIAFLASGAVTGKTL